MTRTKSVELAQRASSRPPSYRFETAQDDIDLEAQVQFFDTVERQAATRGKIDQNDIEAQVQASDTVQRPAAAKLSGIAGSISTLISAPTSNNNGRGDASEQGGTARPALDPMRPRVLEKHPHLGRIYVIQALFGLVQLLACLAVLDGLEQRWDWVCKNKTLAGVPLLTFGVYWASRLLEVAALPRKLANEPSGMGRRGPSKFTYREWKAIVEVLKPFMAAAVALLLYPNLWRLGDTGTEGLD